MTVTANDLYALGLAVGSLLRGHVDPARQDRVLDLIRVLERQAAGGVPQIYGTPVGHRHADGEVCDFTCEGWGS